MTAPKKTFVASLAAGLLSAIFAAGLNAQLIEPTRTLDHATEAKGLLNVLSEPPGMEVQVGGQVIGKTPIFSAGLPAGVHVMRIGDAETDVHIVAGEATSISWFKGSFIEIPRKPETDREVPGEPAAPAPASRPDEKPDARKEIPKDPYYWPLNPRGPIN
jgi:hypothetical protein